MRSRKQTIKKVEKSLATKKQNKREKVRRLRRILNRASPENVPHNLGNPYRRKYGCGATRRDYQSATEFRSREDHPDA